MHRGTVAFVGPKNREIELLIQRLEHEHFLVVPLPAKGSVYRWFGLNSAQAILVGQYVPTQFTKSLTSWLRGAKKTRTSPIIIVGDSAPEESEPLPDGVGERWQLHHLTLAEAVRRLTFAIQVSQLTL